MDRLTQHTSARPWRRFRFNLATAMCVMTAIAILCAVVGWVGRVPHQTVLPSIFIATSWCLFSKRQSAILAWSLWSVAWLVAALHLLFLVSDQFSVLGYATSGHRRGQFITGYLAIVALPTFLSIPVMMIATRTTAGQRIIAQKYIVLSGVLAILDMTVLIALLELLFQYDFPLI